jgi:hypothetical protein
MYDFKKLHPIQLGRNTDGGYVLSNRQIERTKVLLSFGIFTDWSFEKDFVKRKNTTVLYAYDYWCSPGKLTQWCVGYLGKAVLLFAGLNFRKAKRYAANAFDNWLPFPVGFKVN